MCVKPNLDDGFSIFVAGDTTIQRFTERGAPGADFESDWVGRPYGVLSSCVISNGASAAAFVRVACTALLSLHSLPASDTAVVSALLIAAHCLRSNRAAQTV